MCQSTSYLVWPQLLEPRRGIPLRRIRPSRKLPSYRSENHLLGVADEEAAVGAAVGAERAVEAGKNQTL